MSKRYLRISCSLFLTSTDPFFCEKVNIKGKKRMVLVKIYHSLYTFGLIILGSIMERGNI